MRLKSLKKRKSIKRKLVSKRRSIRKKLVSKRRSKLSVRDKKNDGMKGEEADYHLFLNDQETITGNTPLIMASMQKDSEEMVKLLLNTGECNVNLQNNKGNTALIEAILHDNNETVKLLLNIGSDFEIKNNDGENDLDIATKKENIIIKEMLLTHNNYKPTKNIFERIKKNDPDIIYKKEEVNKNDELNRTPLMKAVFYGYLHLTIKLLNLGADVSSKDKNNKTVLMWAASCTHQNVEIIKIICLRSNDINNEDNEGNTALKIAMNKRKTFIADIEVLMENGADIFKTNFEELYYKIKEKEKKIKKTEEEYKTD